MSLNLSNFNTNKVINMYCIFNKLNKKYEIKCNDINLNKILQNII